MPADSVAPVPVPYFRPEPAPERSGVVERNGTERNGSAHRPAPAPEPAPLNRLINEYGDDRDEIRAGDRVLLIVENDTGFARFLLDAAREKGFKGLVTSLGAAALALTREYDPDAISLDIHLPDIDGWRVLERLKKDPATRHIPVCVVSTDDAPRPRQQRTGAWRSSASRSRTARRSTGCSIT